MSNGDRRDHGLLSGPVNAIAASVVPVVTDAVDVDDLVERVDVNGVIERVDINALLARIDLDALLARVDLDALLTRIDLDDLLEGVDINALVDRIDVQQLVGRIDMNEIVDQVDIDDIVAQSTRGFTERIIDLFRRQLVGIDAVIMRAITRLLRREPSTLPSGPPGLVARHDVEGMPDTMSGRYAGPLTRVIAYALDVLIMFGSFTMIVAGAQWLLTTFLSLEIDLGQWQTPVAIASITLYAFFYFWIGYMLVGRTIMMAILGLKVVHADGSPLTPGSAFIRTILLPVNLILFGIPALLILFDRQRRGLHDFAAKSAVVYDWGDRPAALPAPLTRFIEQQAAPVPETVDE